jgi:branched-chain amino acid transport system ATP-binding protein
VIAEGGMSCYSDDGSVSTSVEWDLGMILLEIQDLSAGYSNARVVHGLSLIVREREIAAILGPNGAGKTTTLLSISGLSEIQSGSIHVLGTQPDRRHPHRLARAGLAHVPEDRGLFSNLTVSENLELGTTARAAAKQAVLSEVIDWFPALAPLMTKRCGYLSGGEQQMVALARALVGKPKLLLVDEMSLGLAPLIVENLMRRLRTIADDSGVGMVLVEQHVKVALEVADTATVLVHGHVAWTGPAKSLAESPDLLREAYLGREEKGKKGLL